MDFSRLQHLGPEFLASNASTTSLPSSFLETFIPGYGILSQIVLRLFGIDIGLVVSGCVVIFGLSHAASFFNSYVYSYFDRYFTSSVSVDGHDELYREVVGWVTQQRMTKISRDLRAHTKQRNTHQDSDDDSDEDDDVLGGNGIFNYGSWASNVPPRYEPNYGTDRFVHDGRTFTLSRDRKEKKSWSWDQYDEFLTIRCLGRNTQPIKNLLLHIKKWTLKNENKTTSIYRPLPKSDNGGETGWDRQSNRASRPMGTVSLRREEKRTIVSDINEYLQPETRRWYDARGIPYRRGYLFHGPPGTGKTSLSFALAGIFGLHIYCISLSEVGLAEADLNKLFSELPRRCIVLLEDIDSAGLRRDDEAPHNEPTPPPTSGVAKSSTCDPSGPRKSLISLAGLLNVIDGVASHEGRVLIMTTNRPEALDEALTRPGRVDVRIAFCLATHTQIKEIFMRMYGTDVNAQKPIDMEKSQHTQKPTASSDKRQDDDYDDIEDLLFEKATTETLGRDTLKQMAQEFADKLPEGKFSPAAIQGYLLTRKREPSRALEEACMWRDEQLEATDKKT
ncbi:hypothetical protein EKO04_010743 [Ascochyta lentis]|uniref:P-loop containing nucleoside triphosphate hydrolase protein n=1 Tax=Ascochyta lentis TaxID=205686 RepID=A0A8H7MBM2_9PLEO|nr:hypothetical protein EKO04_010743 [Ascochyta lentis]